jgi:Flp pilus assembly protein CpaB
VAPRRRKARERISLGHLFMIAAALLAFVLVVSVLQDRSETVQVLAARSEILPGDPVTVDQVRQIDVPADSDLADSLATLGAVADGGAIAAQRIGAGDPITLTALAPRSGSGGLRAMSIPIERPDAVGGDLSAGDRVDVISVEGSRASYVAVDLEVLRTASTQSAPGALSTAALTDYYVTVSVDDQTALAIALAEKTGEVSILRSTGAQPVPPDQRVITSSATERASPDEAG